MRRDGGDPTTTVGLGVAQETRGMKRHDGREGSFCLLPRQRVISSQFLYRLLLLLRPLFFFSDASLPFPLPSLSLCFFHFSISSSFLFLWNLMDDDNMHFHDEKGRVEIGIFEKVMNSCNQQVTSELFVNICMFNVTVPSCIFDKSNSSSRARTVVHT